MVKSKRSSKRQQKGNVDFKKIKRKIGKKLPPPKNATNTNIISKAIILPEQSVVSERVGLPLSRKGLTLKELLQQTSHHNSKVRRDAMMGIKDLLRNHLSELKLHKYTIIEKLRERICDDDRHVRETLLQLFKIVIFPNCKEDNQGPLVSLVMSYVFNAMTHLDIDIRLMALKFTGTVIDYHPPSFSLYSHKIVENYVHILGRNKFYLQDRTKLRNILVGLAHCLLLLPHKEQDDESPKKTDIESHYGLHVLEADVISDHTTTGFDEVIDKLKDLIVVLVDYFSEFVPLVCSSEHLDGLPFECLFNVVQCIYLIVSFSIYGDSHYQSLSQHSPSGDICVKSPVISPILLARLWNAFPLTASHYFSDTDDWRCFILNSLISMMCLSFSQFIFPPVIPFEKFLIFIEFAIMGHVGKKHCQKYSLSILKFLPKLLVQLEGYWRHRLLKAFTRVFLESKPESLLKSACLSAVEEFLFREQGILLVDESNPQVLDDVINWMRDLPSLLLKLGDSHPLCSKAVLQLLLRLGQSAAVNPALMIEYDLLQCSLRDFYHTSVGKESVCYGPFLALPRDCQELLVCCIRYFACVDPLMLQSVAFCCKSNRLDTSMLFRILEVVHSSYKSGRVKIEDHISFLFTTLCCFEDSSNTALISGGRSEKSSRNDIYKSLSGTISSYLSEIGDVSLLYLIMNKLIYSQLSSPLPLNKICALLRLLVVLDHGLAAASEENLVNLCSIIITYLIEVGISFCGGDDKDGLGYYILPCFLLFSYNKTLLCQVLLGMTLHICNNMCPNLSKPTAVKNVLLWMLHDPKMHDIVSSCRPAIDELFSKVLSSSVCEGDARSQLMTITEGILDFPRIAEPVIPNF